MKFLATPFLRHFPRSFRELRRRQKRAEMFSLESILAPVDFPFNRNSTFVFSSSMIVFYARTFALSLSDRSAVSQFFSRIVVPLSSIRSGSLDYVESGKMPAKEEIVGRKLGELGQLQYRDTQTYWRNSRNFRKVSRISRWRTSAFRIRRKEEQRSLEAALSVEIFLLSAIKNSFSLATKYPVESFDVRCSVLHVACSNTSQLALS